MMDYSEYLLIDILNILPQEVDCYIQAPSLEDTFILSLMRESNFPYYKHLPLNNINRRKIIEYIQNHPIAEYFQSIEIRYNGKLLFEAHDGVEFGILSKSVTIPNWFTERHIKTETCLISSDW